MKKHLFIILLTVVFGLWTVDSSGQANYNARSVYFASSDGTIVKDTSTFCLSNPCPVGTLIFGTGNSMYVKQQFGWKAIAGGSGGSFTVSLPLVKTGSNITLPLTTQQFFVGNLSGVATGVSMSGDVALSSTGATTVNKILNNTVPVNAIGSLNNDGAGNLTWLNVLPINRGGTGQTSVINSINALNGTGANIAGGSTIDLATATGNYFHVTGSSWTCTSFGTVNSGSEITLVFDGAGVLTYNATSLILPGAQSITTVAGDVGIFRSEGSGNWRCISYQPFSGDYTSYTVTMTGNSSDPPIAAGAARWKMLSTKTCHVIISPTTTGTSNATSHTITLPFNASSTSIQYCTIVGIDNATQTAMTIRTRTGSNIADVFKLLNTANTGSGTWSFTANIVYQID